MLIVPGLLASALALIVIAIADANRPVDVD